VEQWLPHRRDVRCLQIGEAVFAMEPARTGLAGERGHHQGSPDRPAPVLALDALETGDGWVVLESNETPGVTGFPELTRIELAGLLLGGMASA
jgi:hypothetical protein